MTILCYLKVMFFLYERRDGKEDSFEKRTKNPKHIAYVLNVGIRNVKFLRMNTVFELYIINNCSKYKLLLILLCQFNEIFQ